MKQQKHIILQVALLAAATLASQATLAQGAFTERTEIKAELRENGPLMMGLIIYEDFLNYESGVYV